MCEKKDQLKTILNRAIEIGIETKTLGREATRSGQQLEEDANLTAALLDYPFESIDYDSQIAQWGGTVALGEQNLHLLRHKVPTESSSGSPVGQIYVITPQLCEETDNFRPEIKKRAVNAINRFKDHVETVNTKNEAVDLLTIFGLDKNYADNHSPLELLEIGYAAFEKPVVDENPIVTSLIPIRSCIETMIADLLRRRPVQEPANNLRTKIFSIGCQVKYDELVNDLFYSLASTYEELQKQLSLAKERKMDRDEWARIIQGSINFIISFLRALDLNKLKKQ